MEGSDWEWIMPDWGRLDFKRPPGHGGAAVSRCQCQVTKVSLRGHLRQTGASLNISSAKITPVNFSLPN